MVARERTRRRFAWLACGLAQLVLASPLQLFAQTNGDPAERARQDSAPATVSPIGTSPLQATRVEAIKPIPSTELPDPPPDLQQILERGNVRWLTGGPPRETPDSFPASLSLAGETRFKFRYRYDSHARWSYERPSAGQPPTVLLRIRFRSVKLHVSHEVWLKHVPAAEKFWEDPLVRHECDHVRISSMPAIEQQFLDSVKAMKTVHVPLADVAGTDGRVSDREVQQWIDRRMDEALERTTDYVRIRYRELDRLTQHGRLPIPEDRGLIEISPGAPLNR